MKRLLQSVALALAAFLAVQPALAAMTCAQMVCADGHSSMDCCLPTSDASMHGMAMPSMNASGQAPSQLSAEETNCLSEPCCAVSARATTLLAASVKSPLDGLALFTRVDGPIVATVPARKAITLGDAAVPPPDRNALFQTFRI